MISTDWSPHPLLFYYFHRKKNFSATLFCMKIILAADHAGFLLKEDISEWLDVAGYQIEDIGIFDEGSADYPPLAAQAARIVAANKGSRGIFFCGSGNGMAIVANRIPGIRAINAHTSSEVRLARQDGDINVLTLGGRNLIFEQARSIVEDFLETSFAKEERQERRLRQIEDIERDGG